MKLFIKMFFLLISISCFAQNKKSLIWKISGNGLIESSYLFGTIHAIPKDDFFIPNFLKSSILECKNMVLEAGEEEDLSITDTFLKNEFLMPNGQTIIKLYKPSDYEYLKNYFKDTLKISLTKLIFLKPTWILFAISPYWFKNHVAYESFLLNKAIETNKNIIVLETIKEKFAFFNKISIKQQSEMLLNSIKERVKERIKIQTLTKMYLEQDINQLNKEIKSQLKQYPKYYNNMITNRNALWINKIDSLIKKESCFIAVGAGHLGGKDGLIIKLKKLGYDVDPL